MLSVRRSPANTSDGYQAGELWPAPPEHLTAEEVLELLRRVPDRGGLQGWRRVLARGR